MIAKKIAAFFSIAAITGTIVFAAGVDSADARGFRRNRNFCNQGCGRTTNFNPFFDFLNFFNTNNQPNFRTNIDTNANTTVDVDVDANAVNNVNARQNGGRFSNQNLNVNSNADTNVNVNVNANSTNNVDVSQG